MEISVPKLYSNAQVRAMLRDLLRDAHQDYDDCLGFDVITVDLDLKYKDTDWSSILADTFGTVVEYSFILTSNGTI